jgi:hypothetical protein
VRDSFAFYKKKIINSSFTIIPLGEEKEISMGRGASLFYFIFLNNKMIKLHLDFQKQN